MTQASASEGSTETEHRCPECGSGNTWRYAIAYRRGLLRKPVGGMAPRMDPPVAPRSPDDWKARRRIHWLGASPLLGLALAIAFALASKVNNDITGPKLVVTLIPMILGLLILWNGRVPDSMLDEQNYRKLLKQYEDDQAAYEGLWTCLDCGKTFRPQA